MAEQQKKRPGRIGPNPRRHPSLTGEKRVKVAADMAKEYDAGDSIRAVGGRHDRSFGQTRKLLLEAGVTLRERGGPRGSRTRADAHLE